MMPQPMLIAALVGLLSGTHTAIWGMYKDAPHEGFSVPRFLRSAIVGSACAVVLRHVLAMSLDAPGVLLLLFGLAYAAERAIVEVWKTFVRNEDQSKYFIPMQFSVRGEPVKSRAMRLAAGAAYGAVVVFGLASLGLLDRSLRPTTWTMALVGFAAGLIVAVGGAWKDAPKEGFDPLKFMRSPVMTLFYALLLSRLTNSHLLAAAGAIGYERATAETYKTFFFPSKPRGKFSGKPISHPEMLRRRLWFAPIYFAIWSAVLVCGAVALTSPRVLIVVGR
jgi:hypothetical protein